MFQRWNGSNKDEPKEDDEVSDDDGMETIQTFVNKEPNHWSEESISHTKSHEHKSSLGSIDLVLMLQKRFQGC